MSTRRALVAVALAASLAGGSLTACNHRPLPGPLDGGAPTGVSVPCPGTPLLGVYHSYRLKVLATCRWYRGTVSRVKHEEDGDSHVNVDPDAGYEGYLNAVNASVQYGALVTEIMPGQTFPTPTEGEHVAVFGTWVNDTEHDWNEIHPIWAIVDLDTGAVSVSTPPTTPLFPGFGG